MQQVLLLRCNYDESLILYFELKNSNGLKFFETEGFLKYNFQRFIRSWPANGVPSSTKALLEFRRKVNKSYRGR